MLRQPSTFAVRLLALSLESNVNNTRLCRSYCSTAIAERGWIPPEQRHGRRQLPNVRARRPLVNGNTVAFHVNELTTLPAESINTHGIHVDIRNRSSNHGRNSYPNSTRRQYESDMIVVLDMDECLIHSKFMSNQQEAQRYAHQLRAQNHQDLSSSGVAVDSFRVSLNDGTLVHVHVRPGLFEFLQQVCSRYETHIFTAATAIYADPVLDYLESRLNEDSNNSSKDQKTSFAGRWYRPHCTYHTTRRAYVKDLNNLWPQIQYQQNRPLNDTSLLRRAVLVDNNPLSFLSNPENGILVSSFYTDARDNALPEVWNVLQQLENEPDVRPSLMEKFSLKIPIDDQEHLTMASVA